MTRQEKKDIIESEYGIPMTQGMERRVNIMCNLSEAIEECGIEKGRREDIMHMLMNNKTPEQIAEFCGYDLEYVKAIQEEMLQSV